MPKFALLEPEPTLRQELAHSISHGFGILFGVVCIPILVATATHTGSTAAIIGAGIYGFSFLMVFTFSTLYHGFQHPEAKQVLRIMDHISIYFLIAGTYTPFILVKMYDTTGLTLLAVLWGLTLIGIFFKVFFVDRFDLLSTALYVIMGWMLLAVAGKFFASVSANAGILIAAGGVLYSIGVVFYLWRTWTHHHVVWHFFVLAASICHFAAVFLTVSV